MSEANGHFREDVAQIRADVSELKDDLATAIKRLDGTLVFLNTSLGSLTQTIATMITKIESAMELNLQAIPLPFVLKLMKWTFGILVLALAGVEGSKWLFEHYLVGK